MPLGKCWKSLVALLVGATAFSVPQRTFAQILVDCSGATPGAYSTISEAMAIAPNGASIIVTPGGCSEDVSVNGVSNLNIGTWWGERVALTGSININGSQNIYLYGFDVSSPNKDGNHSVGILVTNSTNVMVDACTSRHNQGNGLRVDGQSSAVIQDWGDYSYNGDAGVSVNSHSYLQFVAWGGEIDLMFNKNSGLYIDRSAVINLGHVAINDNVAGTPGGATQPNGFGVDMRGMSTALMAALFGPVEISGNQSGGVSILENSELSIGGNQPWAQYQALIATNGPTGISAGFGSQVSIFGGTQIVEHANVGVDLFGKSQAAFYGDNLITHIGSGMEPGKAALRVDGNSEAYLRNLAITQNVAPGILILVNSSVDAQGVSFASNAGSNVACDSSASIASDMTPAALGQANPCRIQGLSGVTHRFRPPASVPDWHPQKAVADKYKAVASRFHR